LTRHAKNECRLYGIDRADAEAVVAQPLPLLRDNDDRPIYEGSVRGRVIRVIVALDEPDLIVTIYPRRK
jgi:hypothetical protein